MTEYKRKKYTEVVSLIADKFKDKTSLNKKDLELLFSSLIELHEIPFPSKELKKYFIHPNIVDTLIAQAVNSDFLTHTDRSAVHKSFAGIKKLVQPKKTNYTINFRILAPGGNYPNIELERQSSKYTFVNQFPVLITKNRTKKDDWADRSLVNWLTRTELKFAIATMCAADHILFHFHFTSYNSVVLDNNCYEKIPSELGAYFLRELLDIHRRFTAIGVYSWNRRPLPDINEYEFSNYGKAISEFEKIYDKFSIQNDLLLRTCNYLVKARMHWDNHINAEDAITNVFMCLEGCLHLIQNKYGDHKPQLNRNLLSSVFKNDIPGGEDLYEFISDGYQTRITLLHAEPKWGAKWDPFVISEDFYEYYKVCLALLNFILIDRHIVI